MHSSPAPAGQTALVVEVALAAPLWRGLSYLVPPELAPLIAPLTRLLVPLRGRSVLGFALSEPAPGPAEGLQPLLDVLDEPGCPAWPPGLLKFFSRAAAYYQAPLGQALAGVLPAGLGAGSAPALPPRGGQVAVASFRQGDQARRPTAESRAAQLLRLLEREGPQPRPELRRRLPQATALARRLEALGWLAISHRPLVKDLLGRPLWPEPKPQKLSEDQEKALVAILPAVAARRFQPFLLYGVTGSGKTEVYLAACQAALDDGRQALLLTPEIGLCLRLEGLLRDRLGAEGVAVLHSGLSPAARREQWRGISRGQCRVVVGARSAVFAPLSDPGVICVDEAQDEAYKQEDRLRYHGRDLALLRGQEQGCPVVLGSATPAVTTYHRAQAGEITLLSMPTRVRAARLPRMEVLDLRSAGPLEGGFLSRRLGQKLTEAVAAGNQALLFLNRRGFAPALLCTACGQSLGCPACSLALTLHQARARLICHACGFERPLPQACPACGQDAEHMKPLGLGTEAVAARLAELHPDWRIARLDRDTADTPAQLRHILKQVAELKVDVLVGTQMLAKGHHFPRIALVGVLMADQALAAPDYRASERAYALVTQVAGRAGREGGPGLVIVQTYDPHHHALQAALGQRPDDFYAQELAERQALGYPPFRRLLGLRLEGGDQARVERAAALLARHLERARRQLRPAAQLLGPAPAPVARLASRWRYLLLIKSPEASSAAAILRLGLHQAGALPAGVRLIVDVDPLTLG
ncbi:MAG: primosomal protein N' [Desulfarculus sp.]|nr:primosomal protein N' [Desulfarculus sp.]